MHVHVHMCKGDVEVGCGSRVHVRIQDAINQGMHGHSIPVNRPYLGGTVPLLLPLSHRPTLTPFCPTFLNAKYDSEKQS